MASDTELAAKFRACVAQAKAIKNEFEGKDMPAEAAHQMEQLLDKAAGYKARLDLVQTGQPDDGIVAGNGSNFDQISRSRADGKVRILTKDQRVAPEPDDRTLGRLGVLAKTIVGDVDEREVAHYFPSSSVLSFKDMLLSSAGAIVPAPIAGFVIDRLRSQTVVNQLGARVVPMTSNSLKVPRVTQDPTAAWLAEGATITPSDGALDDVTFAAKRLTAIVKFSDELDEDSDPELAGQVLASSLARAFALELDRAALRGSGAGNEPTGIRNTSGVTIQGTTGAATWLSLANMRRDLRQANSDATGFVLAPRTISAVETQTGTDNHFVQPPSVLDGIPRLATSSVPINLGAGTNETEIYAGDWSELMLGLRVRFELRRLNERYADEGKVALRARMRADVKLAHAASFIVRTGVTN